jgi:hypothetical protein
MRILGVTAALVVTAALAAPTGPASAQSGGGGGNEGPHVNLLADPPTKTPDKDSLKKIPDAKAPSDPWGTVRSDAPKTPAKAATTATKPKTKTGSNAN